MSRLMAVKYHLETFGCQMNKYDSERIESILTQSGMERAADPSQADVILLNTCSIRDKAEQKLFSRIGRLALYRKKNKNIIIALGGCMATLRKKEIFKRAPVVDIIFGPDALKRLPELIEKQRSDKGAKGRLLDVEFGDNGFGDGPEPGARQSKISAWVGIAKGCNNHCSYCVVPNTRGREVSRPPDFIIAEVKELASAGYREIILLGQNVNSYGKGLQPKTDFSAFLRLVDKVEGIERIRFMTSHPKDLTDRLIEVMASAKKVCPAIHLPVQAGSDRILRIMNRGYTSSDYIEKVNRLKKTVHGITISTDVMVGFPTETEADFQDTLKVMKEVGFDSIYLFNYSKRPGTRAAERGEEIPPEISSDRFNRALSLHREIISKKNQNLVGTVVDVLCEGAYNDRREAGGDGSLNVGWAGRTPGNHMVFFRSERDCAGGIVRLVVTGVAGYNLRGRIEDKG